MKYSGYFAHTVWVCVCGCVFVRYLSEGICHININSDQNDCKPALLLRQYHFKLDMYTIYILYMELRQLSEINIGALCVHVLFLFTLSGCANELVEVKPFCCISNCIYSGYMSIQMKWSVHVYSIATLAVNILISEWKWTHSFLELWLRCVSVCVFVKKEYIFACRLLKGNASNSSPTMAATKTAMSKTTGTMTMNNKL